MEKSNQQPTEKQQLNQKQGFYRITQIVGDRKKKIEPLLPIGRSTFLAGVKSGKYPAPVKLGPKTTAWRKADILALLESFGGAS